jgi:(Z)-2-((N-methylformamido)methylene)-5-hydroxybutyrolactone dehydrogenase
MAVQSTDLRELSKLWPITTSGELPRYPIVINGVYREASGGEWIPTESPFDGQPWALIARGTRADAEAAVEAAHSAFESGPWPKMSATQRGNLLLRLADLVERDAEKIAKIEMRDNGKLVTEVSGQIRYMGAYLRYFGGLADKVQGSTIPSDKPGVFNYTRLEPFGVVAAITPWNSPLNLTAWKMGPALAAGNTLVIKPSEYTSASFLHLMQLVDEAGFPPGVVNLVTGLGAEVGAPLVEHPKVARVAFTGGEEAGSRIYEAAARSMKHVSLELGGKSPNIVFDDADLGQALKGVVSGIFSASGQTCVAGSRLLVQESIHDDFVRQLIEFVRTAKLGDPSDPSTQIGPIATRPQFEKIMRMIDMAMSEGARCVLGGTAAVGEGFGQGQFVRPTIFTGVRNDMRIAQEEVFGPVLAVIPFKDEDDAIRIGNDVDFGLAAGVWTQNLRRAIKMSERLRAGTVWVNTYRSTSFTSPFGGYKRSGLGRESGVDAIREYMQVKSVWLAVESEVANPFVRR